MEGLLHPGNLLQKGLDFLGAVQDILPVQVAQLNFRHIFRLDLADAEANHQVGDHLFFLLGLPDDGHRLVDIQQDFLEAL